MLADYRVCLDACVLANYGVSDLLFRLADKPRIYTPVFSRMILDEVRRTHVEKLGWGEEIADTWQAAICDSFPEAARSCMAWIKTNYPGYRVGLPLIGAGLAGGDWERIKRIMKEELKGEDVTIVHYKP